MASKSEKDKQKRWALTMDLEQEAEEDLSLFVTLRIQTYQKKEWTSFLLHDAFADDFELWKKEHFEKIAKDLRRELQDFLYTNDVPISRQRTPDIGQCFIDCIETPV